MTRRADLFRAGARRARKRNCGPCGIAAIALGQRMLDHAVLPDGAQRSTSDPPAVLSVPSQFDQADLAISHALWTVPGNPQDGFRWLQTHVQTGFTRAGTSTGTDNGVPSWGVNDTLMVDPANVSSAELDFGIAATRGGGSIVRVDTVVGWTEPRPADEFVRSADRTVTVTVVHTFDRAAPPGKRVVTSDPKLVGPIVRAFNRLKVAPPEGVHGCPAMGVHTVSYRIAFATSPRAKPDIVATMGKCSRGPGVSISGRAAPTLRDTPTGEFADAVAHVFGFTEPHFG